MTKPHIEEMAAQYAEMLDSVQEKYEFQRMSTPQREETEQYLTKALTEAHQAGKDEAVEILKGNKLDLSKGGNQYGRGYNQALDNTIKALKDTNSEDG